MASRRHLLPHATLKSSAARRLSASRAPAKARKVHSAIF